MSSGASTRYWFPDFCRWPAIFALAVIAELVVLIMVLAPGRHLSGTLAYLGITSLFVQWLALSCAVVLCYLRKPLNALGVGWGSLLAWVVVVAMTALASSLAVTLDHMIGMGYVSETAFKLVLGNVSICALVAAATLRYFYVQQRWRGNIQATAEAQVKALQARIRPHFLFNSMNTIASLIGSRPEAAERAVEDLSELFRAALAPADANRTLGQELALCRRYLDIEHLRLGSRLEIIWEIDALPMELALPPLIIQPLLENALYHGIQPRPDGGTVALRGQTTASGWRITIDNPLPASPSASSGHGIALDNIESRLYHRFGAQAKLNMSVSPERCRVTLDLPRGGSKPRDSD